MSKTTTTTKILRHKLFAPKVGEDGSVSSPSPKQTLNLPVGSSVLYAEPSSKGGFNLWSIGGDPETTEKRAFLAVRTGVELPDSILDARHVGTYQGIHLFELAKGTAKDFAEIETGLEA